MPTRAPKTWSPLPDQPDRTRGFRYDDVATLAWLAEVRYATTTQVARWTQKTDRTWEYRLHQLARAGYVQQTFHREGRRRVSVWTASRHASGVLAEDDAGWRHAHPHWTSVADQQVMGQAISHALARNDVCLDMLDNADQLGWPASWHFPTPRWVEPVTGTVVVPDAWLTLAGHPWIVEMERSWRTSTLHAKVAQYAAFYRERAWSSLMPRLPRVLIILTEASTQGRMLSAWLGDLDFLRQEWLVVLPWAEVQSTWRVWSWSATGERRQVSWTDLHRDPPRLAPPSPVVSPRPVRRHLRVRPAPDLPWEDERDR